MNKKQKKDLFRIVISAALMVALHFSGTTGIMRFLLYLIPYLIIGYDILIKAVKGIFSGQAFDENFLMAIATVGAMALGLKGSGDYVEAVAVMLFYQIGEWFQSYAVGKSRKNILDLMDIRPEYANVADENGNIVETDPEEVETGTVIVVRAGEKIPIDGIIEEGTSSLNMAALTGESKPRDVEKGDSVISGSININGVLRIRTTREFSESTVSRIMELIEDASSRRSKSEDFITRFARVYTPAVVFSALALFLLPPIFMKVFTGEFMFDVWLYRALVFLVISCPCALVISIPLSFFAGIGCASKEGVLVKGSSYLEALSDMKTVVFDKTGTLTEGSFAVTNRFPSCLSEEELLHMAAHAERYSDHPVAAALKEAYGDEKDDCRVENVEELAGRGIKAEINGHTVYAGNMKLMREAGINTENDDGTGTTVYVSYDGEYAGRIEVADKVKPHSAEAVSELKKRGVSRVVMLTGDDERVARDVAGNLGIDEVYASLMPENKVEKVETLLNEKKSEDDKVVFVGDGINDAPVLTRADVGIAMGALGSDAAIEAADVVLMDDDPMKLITAFRISKKCLSIVKQNIVFAIGVKVLCLILGALGIANMWTAIFADVGVMVIAVLNSLRCMKT